MDILTLKRYFIDQLIDIGKAKKSNSKPQNSFTEFFINNRPLSALLDDFYASKHFITLKNNIGVLGSKRNTALEIIKVKQLLGKTINKADFDELMKELGRTIDKNTIKDIIDSLTDELAEPGIMIYCCARCGDYQCGGVMVEMVIDEHYIKWTFGDAERNLVFVFDKYAYLGTIRSYLDKIKTS